MPSWTSFMQMCCVGGVSDWQRQYCSVVDPSVRSRCLQIGHSQTRCNTYFNRSYGPFMIVSHSTSGPNSPIHQLLHLPARLLAPLKISSHGQVSGNATGFRRLPAATNHAATESLHASVATPVVYDGQNTFGQPQDSPRRTPSLPFQASKCLVRSYPIKKIAASISRWLSQGPSSERLQP